LCTQLFIFSRKEYAKKAQRRKGGSTHRRDDILYRDLSGIWYLLFGFCYLAFVIWFLLFGIWPLVFEI